MRISCFLPLLLSLALTARGQDVPTLIWKRNVSRDIDARDERTSQLPKSPVNDSTVSQIIVSAVFTGKVAAYWLSGPPSKMTHDGLLTAIFGQIDTFGGDPGDPVSGGDPPKTYSFSTDSLYKYRVYEEWNYYPSEGKMNVQTIFITPIKEIYGDDGIFRGDVPTLKLKYDELVALLYSKNDSGICYSLLGKLWKSHFCADTGKAKEWSAISPGIWHATAIGTIDMREPEDTQKHFLKNENDDTPLSELIVKAIENREIHAWNAESEPFSKILDRSQLEELTTDKTDTFIIDATFEYKRTWLDYSTVHRYKILEYWTFDPMTGETEIVIKGVAPVRVLYDDNGKETGTKTMFWIQFTDLQKILSRVEQYHPANTFAMHIWDSCFMTDLRPVFGN